MNKVNFKAFWKGKSEVLSSKPQQLPKSLEPLDFRLSFEVCGSFNFNLHLKRETFCPTFCHGFLPASGAS